jgi:myo-inositol 2-dehydrogenase/D-chiro-inositol 1-dehydrogenase
MPQIKIKAVSDVVVDHLHEWAASKEISTLTTNYQDLLADPEIDAVFICSPTNTHASIIKEAARAKKHIFCEKPVSFSVEETIQALEVVKNMAYSFKLALTDALIPTLKKCMILYSKEK